MAANLAAAQEICLVDQAAAAVLTSPQRPIVLMPRRNSAVVVDHVAPGNLNLGVFLPYTPLHHLLFAGADFIALVMTSGNISEEPIAIDNHEALDRLQGMADFLLVHNRDILRRCDDSVVRIHGGRLCHVRRSRGYVPVPVALREELPAVLAVGGELKNTVCLTRGANAFLSQHIGDLENLESYRFFEEAIAHLQHVLETKPIAIAHDLHPRYLSTQWADRQKGLPRIAVQHHHAHIASCMAEHGLSNRVIGIALDGTGFGTDGAVWGGEVLLADEFSFDRAAHFEYVPMPGGEAAIREPWRMAAGYLHHCFGAAAQGVVPGFWRSVGEKRAAAIWGALERRVNSPLTSSCGRMFDAVAALCGLRRSVTYEGQAAMELEGVAAPDECGAYRFELDETQPVLQIRVKPLFEEVCGDWRAGVSADRVSARFHNAVVEVLRRVSLRLREKCGVDRVCLSGGCFQNAVVLESLRAALVQAGFSVFTHSQVPSNDGGLSLGQAYIAAHLLARARERRNHNPLR
jgi:hydrogenase maturation protein HypF